MNSSIRFPELPPSNYVSPPQGPDHYSPLGCTRPDGPLRAACAPHVRLLRGAHITGVPAADSRAPQVCVTICTGEQCAHHVYNSPLWRLR